MKKRILLLAILIVVLTPLKPKAQSIFYPPTDTNIFQAVNNFYLNYDSLLVDTSEGGFTHQFEKWKNYWLPRLYPSGNYQTAADAYAYYAEHFQDYPRSSTNYISNWTELGPKINGLKGIGRINAIAFDPENQNIMYAGAPSGGVFKTTNGGQNWFNLNTDKQLPRLGINDIAVDPNNPSIIYIATGDADGMFAFSDGVFRTTDGGANWSDMSSSQIFTSNSFYQTTRLLVDPSNNNIMYVATSIGIYKTTNRQVETPNWTKVYPMNSTNEIVYTVIFANNNYNTLYASGINIIKSTNGGDSWSSIASGNDLDLTGAPYGATFNTNPLKPEYTKRINIGLASDNSLYAQICNSDNPPWTWASPSYSYFYKLDTVLNKWDRKGSWIANSTASNMPFIESRISLAILPDNPQIVFSGCIALTRSINSGVNWAFTYPGHDDKHTVKVSPWDSNVLFIGTDGGIWKITLNPTTHDTLSCVELNNGLGISTIYGLGTSELTPDQMLIGQQDCGIHMKRNGNWYHELSSDGMQCLIDYKNDKYIYGTTYREGKGTIHRGILNLAYTVWTTIMSNTPATPVGIMYGKVLQMDENDPKIMYQARKDIFRIDNARTGNVNNWRKISDFKNQLPNMGIVNGNDMSWGEVSAFKIAPSDTSYMYGAIYWGDKRGQYIPVNTGNCLIFRTTTGGGVSDGDWEELSCNPTPLVSDIAVSTSDPRTVWFSHYGYVDGYKVKKSTDAGDNWIDYSEGLPNMPVNCITYLKNSPDFLFVGTDVGVFMRGKDDPAWVPFMVNLPNVPVMELEINYTANKLRAGTWGRGCWETDLPCFSESTPVEITSNITWNRIRILSSDLIIKNNSTLTIKNTVQIPNDAHIIIEPGSKLIVDGGILTNSCPGGRWGGIEVQGNPMSQLLPAYQGYVELKSGAIIENAETGIHCILNLYQPNEDGPACYASGGIINADSSFFKNNLISVEIEPYISGTSYNSTIKNCTFEYTDTITSEMELIYIKLTSVQDVNIFTNNFEGNTANAYNNRGIGIASHDATFDLNDADPPTSNDFNNMTYGIACYNTNGNTSPDISVTNFTDCWRSIYLSGVSNANVLVNNISYKSQTSTAGMQAYGIYLDNCTGYHVEGNILSASNTTAKPEYGIIINNSGANNNKIYRNKFTNIKYPVNAQNANRSTTGNTGLQILCNNCIDAVINDILVTSQTDGTTRGIRLNQGYFTGNPNTSIPAGNLFTYNENISYKNYINSSPNLFNYARYAQTGVISYQNISHYVTPKIYSINAKINLQNTQIEWSSTRWEGTDCKDSTGLSGGGKSLNGMEGYKEQIGVLQGKIDIANNLLMQKMDNGNTTSLINRINSCGVSGYGKLYSDLRKYSPYLSEEVLLALIHKQGFQTNLLVNLMLVNTHVAKTYWLMDALREIQPPLTIAQLEQIQSKDQVYSEMEIERMQLSNLIAQRDNLYNGIESFYAHDSLPQSNDSLCMMLQRDPRLTAKYELVYHYFAKNDSVNADQLLNQIPQLFALDANEQSEYSKYKQLYEMKRQLQREGKGLDKLNEQQKQILIDAINVPSLSLSEMNDLNTLRQADNLTIGKMGQTRGKGLTLNYMEPILEPIENKGLISDNSKETKSEELLMEGLIDQVLMGENTLLLYPNPTVDEVNILYNVTGESNNVSINNVSIEISDLTGRVIGKYTVDKKENHLKINTQSFKKGIYYVILVVDGKNQKIDKLVVQ